MSSSITSTNTWRHERHSKAEPVDLVTLVKDCYSLLLIAADRIRQVEARRAGGAELHVTYKDEEDIRSALTEADKAAQAAIVPPLRRKYPNVVVIGEEEDDDEEQEEDFEVPSMAENIQLECDAVDPSDVVIFVDPVDGTREFVDGNLQNVQILVGICIRGRPVMGVVAVPFASGGPVLVASVPEAKVLNMSLLTPYERPEDEDGVVAAISKNQKGTVAAVIEIVRPSRTMELGAAGNKMLRIVRGEADVVVLNLITQLWDTAGPSALVLACGGTVTDFFGAPLVYNANSRLANKYGVVATGPKFSQRDALGRTHAQVCAEIRKCLVADALLHADGLHGAVGDVQASDVARTLDGDPLSLDFLRRHVSDKVEAYCAPESGAIRYLMSDAVRIQLLKCDQPSSVFLKRVVMADLSHMRLKQRTAPEKLERDVKSYQVEASFLSSAACNRFVSTGANIALPYFVDQRVAPADVPAIESRFLLLLQDFSPIDGWNQYGLFDGTQARACLSTLAKMHAFFWDLPKDELDELNNNVWKAGSYWSLNKQPSKQFECIDELWKKRLAAFGDAFDLIDGDNHDTFSFPLSELGKVLQRHAYDAARRIHVDGEFSPSHTSNTLVHGDPKAANFFLRHKVLCEDIPNWEVGLIDFQWTGWGHPALDVAYFLVTSIRADVISIEEGALIEHYLQELSVGGVNLMKDKFIEAYEDAIVDLGRLVISYHWERINASREVLLSRSGLLGSNSYNKNLACARWLVHKLWAVLSLREKILQA